MKYIVHGSKNKNIVKLTYFGVVEFWPVEAGWNVAFRFKLRSKVR